MLSDWGSIKQVINHGSAVDKQQAGMLSLLAGVDMDMQSSIEPGEFKVWVGGSSVGGLEGSFKVISE